MSASDLSSALWVSRTAMEQLLYKMEMLLLTVSSGRTEWLQHASREVEEATTQLGKAQLNTEVMISHVAKEWELPEGTTLANLVEHGPHEVWVQLLKAHLDHIRELESRITAASKASAQFAARGAISAQEALAQAGLNTTNTELTEARILDKAL